MRTPYAVGGRCSTSSVVEGRTGAPRAQGERDIHSGGVQQL